MDPNMVGFISIGILLLGQLVGAAFIYGKFHQKVCEHAAAIDILKQTPAALSRIEVHLAQINGGILATTAIAKDNKANIAKLAETVRDIEIGNSKRRGGT